MASSPYPTPASTTHTLSPHDSHVLSSILNPDSLSTTTPIDPSLPPLPLLPPALLPTLQAREISAICPLNNASPASSDIQTAIASLTNIINEHPKYASAYSNRAQALRMLLGDNVSNEAVYKSTLWTDLATAIELAAPASPHVPVSPLQSKILACAYTHRGHLVWQLAKSTTPVSNSPHSDGSIQPQPQKPTLLLPPQLQGKSKERLEEMASRDFEMGGRYGNEVAREMAKGTNPYAKLCGEIVREAMRAEMGGRGGERGSVV